MSKVVITASHNVLAGLSYLQHHVLNLKNLFLVSFKSNNLSFNMIWAHYLLLVFYILHSLGCLINDMPVKLANRQKKMIPEVKKNKERVTQMTETESRKRIEQQLISCKSPDTGGVTQPWVNTPPFLSLSRSPMFLVQAQALFLIQCFVWSSLTSFYI